MSLKGQDPIQGPELVEVVDGTLDFAGVLSEDFERYISSIRTRACQ